MLPHRDADLREECVQPPGHPHEARDRSRTTGPRLGRLLSLQSVPEESSSPPARGVGQSLPHEDPRKWGELLPDEGQAVHGPHHRFAALLLQELRDSLRGPARPAHHHKKRHG